MEILGLLGFPVEHSFSQKIHTAVIKHLGLDYVYKLYNIPQEKLKSAIEGIRLFGLKGVNVTVPHKVAVIPFLDRIEASATSCGAVNTIVNNNGELVGYNTDYDGIKGALNYHGFVVKDKSVLVLGAGGAAKAVVAALTELQAERIYIANRTYSFAQDLAKEFTNTQAIEFNSSKFKYALDNTFGVINTTTVGMYPNITAPALLTAQDFKNINFVYDIIYNPRQTALLKEAQIAGCENANGIEMLLRQGAQSFFLWTGIKPPLEVMRNAIAEGETR